MLPFFLTLFYLFSSPESSFATQKKAKKTKKVRSYESPYTKRGEVQYYFFTHLYSIPGLGISGALAFHPYLHFGLFLTHELSYSQAKRYGGMFFRSELLQIRDSTFALRGNLFFNRLKGLEVEWVFRQQYPFLVNLGYHDEKIFYLGMGLLFRY